MTRPYKDAVVLLRTPFKPNVALMRELSIRHQQSHKEVAMAKCSKCKGKFAGWDSHKGDDCFCPSCSLKRGRVCEPCYVKDSIQLLQERRERTNVKLRRLRSRLRSLEGKASR